MDLTLNQLLNLGQLAALVLGGVWTVFKMGQKFDRLIQSIEKVLEDHEKRITVLEGGRDSAA